MISAHRAELLGVLQTRHALLVADELLAAPWDDAPIVCPGCYAVGVERCAPGCIDDEIRREQEDAIGRGEYDRSEGDE